MYIISTDFCHKNIYFCTSPKAIEGEEVKCELPDALGTAVESCLEGLIYIQSLVLFTLTLSWDAP